MSWSHEEVTRLSKRFGINYGVRLHTAAEDYHFPDKEFLSDGYTSPGGYVKDFSVVMAEGRLHLFHIDGRPGEVCWVTGNEISFGHASTLDYSRWIRHPMPLSVGVRSWESEHVWAPFIYRRDDLYYMFYMGSGKGESFISYATSYDLKDWTRWNNGPIRCASGRDPFVYDNDGETILLYTGHGGAKVSACASNDMVNWESLPDLIIIPGGIAAESCSLHPIDERYVLWFNDYREKLRGFRIAYALSDDPFKFDEKTIREFRFITNHPDAKPSRELPVSQPVPLSIELVASNKSLWFVCYFRWHIDRNRLFFGSIDWSSDPAVITEINDKASLSKLLQQVNI